MRKAMLGFCIVAVACSRQPVSPTAHSNSVDLAQTQRQGSGSTANIEVTFTKWVEPSFPAFVGVAGGDVPGRFAATVLRRTAFENGKIIQLEARYEVIGDDAGHSFVALIEGTQNTQTQQAVLNGTIVEGWRLGAQVHVAFDVLNPCPQFQKSVCFTGTIRVMSGSAH
jgi:hypothetical protein